MTSDIPRFWRAALLCAASMPVFASGVRDAIALENQGKFREASEILRSVTAELRASGDTTELARALSATARVDVSLGKYGEAIQMAREAISIRAGLQDPGRLSEDYNTLGLANVYLGNYDEALSNYQGALEIDRRRHDVEGEVLRENNIGNVHYFRGRYQDALRAYLEAMDAIGGAGEQSWIAQRRQLTVANLGALYQRLGKERAALELYHQLTASRELLLPAEYAQFLLNEGVLYRRLGDPVKALELYRAAQSTFAAAHHRDGEIGALRNIGILHALDLDDLNGAREAFAAAMDLARESSDMRGIVQAALYRAEVYRRLGRAREAKQDFETALLGARKIGLTEEQWKSEYGLGRLAEADGDTAAAGELYRNAIGLIESVRAGIGRTALRSEFLADKQEVYDSLIALDLAQPDPPLAAIFALMETSRARALEERAQGPTVKPVSPRQLQESLLAGTVLVEFWAGESDLAALWISRAGSGLIRRPFDGRVRLDVTAFDQALQNGDGDWKRLSRSLGELLLAGIPPAAHLVASLDGPLSVLPLEALTVPGSDRLLIETSDLAYVPAARFVRRQSSRTRGPLPPWRRQFVAYGDPPVTGKDAVGDTDRWKALPAAADEIESIAALLPGRSEVHLGRAARKRDLLSGNLAGTSLLHFSTHALVDTENPDRSRILLASDSAASPLDYLFQQEIFGLNLQGVDLATLSACETARGEIVRGDGVRAFSQAFLAAGAAATVTSLWQVADRPAAEFMKQFYYFLARGQTKSQALRSAKLEFLRSGSRMAAPRYWSAFVLTGDGWDPCARVLPWSLLLAAAGGVLVLVRIAIAWRRRERRPLAASVAA